VLLASALGLYGFVFGAIAVVLLLSSMESFGVPYLSTMTTLVPEDVKDTVVRVPWWKMALRPRYLASKDRQRLQGQTRSKN
jgi:spore germination protein KA